MKIIWINNAVQDENTKDPQLIDGVLYYWNVRSEKLHFPTLMEEIEARFVTYHDDNFPKIKYLLIYDVMAIPKYVCMQGCKPGEGCRTSYREDDHALMVRWFKINEDK